MDVSICDTYVIKWLPSDHCLVLYLVFIYDALTLLVGRPVKNGGWWRWALVGPDRVAPSRMVSVSASVSLPLHHKVQKFYSGTG